MDEEHQWFRELPADQRSWVTLVAQAGLQSFVNWLRSPEGDVTALTGEVFAAAPQAMARSVSLRQTVELVRDDDRRRRGAPADAGRAARRRDRARGAAALQPRDRVRVGPRLRRAPPRVAGSWDSRLEALVIDSLVRGSSVGDPLSSQLAALGWVSTGPIAAIVGTRAGRATRDALAEVHRRSRPPRLRRDVRRARHPADRDRRRRAATPTAAAASCCRSFGDGPVVRQPSPRPTWTTRAPSRRPR